MVSPAWTPDSRYVIATERGRELELKMYHVQGGSGLPGGRRERGEDPARRRAGRRGRTR